MNQRGETRTGFLNIIAACIIAGGVLGGALIIARRPGPTVSTPGARAVSLPV